MLTLEGFPNRKLAKPLPHLVSVIAGSFLVNPSVKENVPLP
jgi:hypothetical protein